MSKSVTALLLVVVLLFSFTYTTAENFDLTSLSYDELISLRDQIMDEIITRPEWEEVLVPAGAYEIGVDIPEGMWTITAESYSDPYVNIGVGIDETHTNFSGGCIEWAHLTGVNHKHYDSSKTVSVTWNFSKGHYFISDGPTVFTHAIRPALNFSGN